MFLQFNHPLQQNFKILQDKHQLFAGKLIETSISDFYLI